MTVIMETALSLLSVIFYPFMIISFDQYFGNMYETIFKT